jgi:hypothetical protein
VEVVGLGGLLHLPEVADIVATLEVLDDPTANAALLRLLTGPRWRIGPRDLVLLGRRAQQLVRPAAGHGVSRHGAHQVCRAFSFGRSAHRASGPAAPRRRGAVAGPWL